MSTDYLANATIFCAMSVLLIAYCSLTLLPPWDDGSGLAIDLSQSPAALRNMRESLSREHATKWVNSLAFEWFPEERSERDSTLRFAASLKDVRGELGRVDPVRVMFCQQANSAATSFCPCDSKRQAEFPCVSSTAAVEQTLQSQALKHAQELEAASFDRLCERLRHYYQTNTGIDVLLTAIFVDNVVEVEKASVATRHTRWISQQPRVPPPRDRDAKLVLTLADRDERWVHDLSMDAQAHALKHAPFVFPVALTMLVCALRMLIGPFKRKKAAK